MTKPVAEATIVGDFRDGTKFADHDCAFTFGRKDGKPFVSVSFGGRPPETFTVDYTLGAKRYQGYLSMLPEGRIYVLPVFWHIAKQAVGRLEGDHADSRRRARHPADLERQLLQLPRDEHRPGLRPQREEIPLDVDRDGHRLRGLSWPGPRSRRDDGGEREKNPAAKPKYDSSAKNRQLSETLKIFSTRSSEPRRIYDTCAYCHGNKNNVFVGFKGGDNYSDSRLPVPDQRADS